MQITRHRAAARLTGCANNLKQLGLGFHNYHAAYKQLPRGAGGTDTGGESKPLAGNSGRLSAFVALTPFLEHQPLWEKISNPQTSGAKRFPPMGPVPWFDADEYEPWSLRPSLLVCSDEPAAETYPLASSYVMNYGDGVSQVFFGPGDFPRPNDTASYRTIRSNQRGVFGRQLDYKFRDILDGLSNTLMLAEAKFVDTPVAKDVTGLPLNPSLAIEAQKGSEFWPAGRDARWCDGLLRSSGFQTILPPGSPSATSDEGDQTAVMSASSHHGEGCHVLMCDGAVRFVKGSIDAGDPSSPSIGIRDGKPISDLSGPGRKSPYGLWGALGTRASKETIRQPDGNQPSAITEPRASMSPLELEAVKSKPIRTWTSAGGGTMKGWLVSCSAEGEVVLADEGGALKYLKLSDLAGEDAYAAVESIVSEKLKARDQLMSQMKEAVGLLEKKDFATFLQQYVDATTMELRQMTAVSSIVYLQRGYLIQAFDDAIRSLENGAFGIEMVDNRMLATFGDRRRGPAGGLIMHYSNGRWYMSVLDTMPRIIRQ